MFVRITRMRNCLFIKHKVVRVMKPDGKILEYKSPIKAHHVLSQFSHHAIADHLPPTRHIHPNADLAGPRLYYLLPLPVPSPKPVINKNKSIKKRVRFSDDARDEPEWPVVEATGGAVRIKLVISKQELRAMLSREGVSAESRGDGVVSKGCTPPLGSVPEN